MVRKAVWIHPHILGGIKKTELFFNRYVSFNLKITLNVSIVWQKRNGLSTRKKAEVFNNNTNIAVAPCENNVFPVADPVLKLLHHCFKGFAASHIVICNVRQLFNIAAYFLTDSWFNETRKLAYLFKLLVEHNGADLNDLVHEALGSVNKSVVPLEVHYNIIHTSPFIFPRNNHWLKQSAVLSGYINKV